MLNLIEIPLAIFRNNRGTDKLVFLWKGMTWFLAKRAGISFVARLWNGARIEVSPSSAYSGVFYFKYPEGKDMEFLRANSGQSDVFVDVGANVGIFSALMADKTPRVVMFEPDPGCFKSIEAMAALNRTMAEFELHNLAVSDRKGQLHFLSDGALSTTGRLVDQEQGSGANVSMVRVDTLDNVLGDRFDRVVMKMDIEGGEEKAFLGATRLFNERRVKLVMFERLGRTNLEAIEALLSSCRYEIFRVLDDGSLATSRDLVGVPLINLFACPAGSMRSMVRV